MTDRTANSASLNRYPLWAPRFWHGMLFADWVRLLSRNRFRVHPLRWGLAGTVTFATLFNFKMHVLQKAIWGHRVARTALPRDPIFVLGHWRSGTTFLHELLSADERFTTPTTFQCFCANHFLLTEAIIPRVLFFLLPSRRPMDNVAAGWQAPQEDEFALCAMGIPSPYLRMAFPKNGDEYLDYLDMEGLDPQELNAWQDALREFLRCLSMRGVGRLVLKSPTHTGRVGLLARMFPEAKFIHIVRDPYAIVPSTLRLWRSLDDVQALQVPDYDDLEDYVFRAYERMYGGFEKQRSELAEDRLIDIQYEDLVRDSCGTLARVYERLNLGDFEPVRPKLLEMLAQTGDYQITPKTLDDDLRAKINRHWAAYFERYGYPQQPVA
jgi:hypothetical protein